MADDLQSVILDCAKLLGYTSLKEKQNEAICAFIEGCDILCHCQLDMGSL